MHFVQYTEMIIAVFQQIMFEGMYLLNLKNINLLLQRAFVSTVIYANKNLRFKCFANSSWQKLFCCHVVWYLQFQLLWLNGHVMHMLHVSG